MYWGGLGGGLMGLMNSLVRNPARKQLTVFFFPVAQAYHCSVESFRFFFYALEFLEKWKSWTEVVTQSTRGSRDLPPEALEVEYGSSIVSPQSCIGVCTSLQELGALVHSPSD
jgi:hypothetical protein